jgi:tetrahydromethanopterin S-methyltransferase subunit E
MKDKKQSKQNSRLTTIAVAISIISTFLVLNRTFELVRDLRSGIQGAPNSYAFFIAIASALYVLIKARNLNLKYVAVALIAVCVTGLSVWLFGVTTML